MALLLQGGWGWERYVPRYVDPWLARGVTHYDVIVPDEEGRLDVEAACAVFENGAFVGCLRGPVHEITMEDFATRGHTVVECRRTYVRS